jgi:hypothetical protein
MREVSKEELQEILKKHELYLNGKEGGERADLREADLHGADLREADLSFADLYGADFRKANLSGAGLREADLSFANLREADLTGADLREANLFAADLREADLTKTDFRRAILNGANLDFSALPLWCGSLGMKVDEKLAIQITYHLCSLNCDSERFIKLRNGLLDFANEFHLRDECGKLKPILSDSTE